MKHMKRAVMVSSVLAMALSVAVPQAGVAESAVSVKPAVCENVFDADLGDLVKCRAAHTLTKADLSARTYEFRFVFRNANGDRIERFADVLDEGFAEATLDAADLPAGENEMGCVIREAKGKRELSASSAKFTPVANPRVFRDAPQRTKDAKPGEPVIIRLGTTAVGEVESNPVVFRGKPYVFEHVRWKKAHVRSYLDITNVLPTLACNLQMPCAFVEGGRIYVTGTRKDREGVHGTYMMESDDLRTWTTPHEIVSNMVGVAYNTTIAKADGRYVLATEFRAGAGEPLANPGYQMRFAESTDLKTWRVIPGTAFVRNAGSPCLRYHDGWFYFFHLFEYRYTAERRPVYSMRVARSRNLKDWDISPKHVLDPVHEDRRPYPGAALTAKDRVKMLSAENRNASDIDMCEYGGDLIISYSWGDQLGKEFLCLAKVRGMSEKDFCESFYK